MITVERRHAATCIHGRARFCSRCVSRRRRVARLLDLLITELDPPRPPDPPSSFGLSPVERCSEAQRLRAAGWSAGEVRHVLAAVDPECLELVEELLDAG